MRRAQSTAIGFAILSLIVGAIVIMTFTDPTNTLHSFASNETTNQTAQTGLDYSLQVFNALPFIFASVVGVGLIVRAIYSRGGP